MSRNDLLRIFEQQKKLLLTHWRGDKSKADVEPYSILIDGVGQHSADSGLLGNQHRTPDSILQQAKAYAAPLILLGYGQSCQDHHW